ncbi:MAG: DUF2510 domain-containing protein [Micropruina sp.]|nr:DUF2510 domain-containing protein [Micropruina sp.]
MTEHSEAMAHRVNAIIRHSGEEWDRVIGVGDIAEAKRLLMESQRDLRDVKRDIADAERQIREAGTEARLKVTGTGQVMGTFMGSKVRGAMAQGRAIDKRRIAEQQHQMLAAYTPLKSFIAQKLAEIDRIKAQLVTTQPTAAVPPPPRPVAPSVPPRWAPDPAGKHEQRWWDGWGWTEHVTNHGITAVDPLP